MAPHWANESRGFNLSDFRFAGAMDGENASGPEARLAAAMAVGAGRADPIGSVSFSKVNDPKGIRTPVHPLWRYEE